VMTVLLVVLVTLGLVVATAFQTGPRSTGVFGAMYRARQLVLGRPIQAPRPRSKHFGRTLLLFAGMMCLISVIQLVRGEWLRGGFDLVVSGLLIERAFRFKAQHANQ
jgi:hypothetical protein